MKWRFIIIFLFISILSFSQNKVVKKIETKSKEIEISTLGLDDFVIENSASNFIEIFLVAENIEEKHIVYKEEYNLVKIQFEIPDNKQEDIVFRKFITKRLHRASAIIKVPKNKIITIFGDEINVESKSYKGDLKIFIEKGILKLHTIHSNLQVKMYTGNLYAKLNNGTIDVVSKTGKIKINDILVKKSYQKKEKKLDKEISIHSLNANIFLTTK
jgi:hypothetical protein